MPTAFSFEHVFRASSAETVLEAYFDPDHLAAQDKLAELGDRTVIESEDTGAIRRCSWRVRALRPLPLYARPFVSGGHVSYVEAMTYRRADGAIDLLITPEILGGRVQIAAIYELQTIGERQVRRRYHGTIAVNVRLISGKVERGIREKMEEVMPIMTECTQGWLDRNR